MPTYEYVCDNEGCDVYQFSKSVKVKDSNNVSCIKCGCPATKVLTKHFGIAFKGPGFHSTDYRSK
jgi:putative FmdB family regulatory protein